MNADRVISKINHDMNDFNESGSREDKACAEGLRRARTYIQLEVLKRKILTHDQQVVLEWLKSNLEKGNYPMMAIVNMQSIDEGDPCFYAYENMTTKEDWEVLAAFVEWGLSTLDN